MNYTKHLSLCAQSPLLLLKLNVISKPLIAVHNNAKWCHISICIVQISMCCWLLIISLTVLLLIPPSFVENLGCNTWLLEAQKNQWVVWIHLSFAVALKPMPRWRTLFTEKKDLCNVADIMSSCCKSTFRPISGRHLWMSFLWKASFCGNMSKDFFLFLVRYMIHILTNTVFLIKKNTSFLQLHIHTCMQPAHCNDEEGTSIQKGLIYKIHILLYVYCNQVTASTQCFLWLKHHATRSCLYLSLCVLLRPLLAVTHTCKPLLVLSFTIH